jgi:hypothetical protein
MEEHKMHDIFPATKSSIGFNLGDYRLNRVVLSPTQWRNFNQSILLNWTVVPFTPTNTSTIPDDCSGVYSFIVKPGIANHPGCSYLLYIGKVEKQNFRARYRQYLREKAEGINSRRPHITDMLLKWDGFLSFCYAPVASETSIENIENELLAAYLPPANKDFPASISHSLRRVFAH